MALQLLTVLFTLAILFIASTLGLAEDNVDSLPNTQRQPSSNGDRGFSIIVMNSATDWLKITLVPNKNGGQDIRFATVESNTYPLYCPAIPNKNTMPISNDGKVDVLLVHTTAEMKKRHWTKCVAMHIVGDLLKPEIAIPSYVSSSCRAKYFITQIKDDPLKKFAKWTNNYMDLKILMAMSIDNARGEVSCYGDSKFFDLSESTISFITRNQSFMAGQTLKQYVDGLAVIQGMLGWKTSPILDLTQAKCTMCFKLTLNQQNEKEINDQNNSKRTESISTPLLLNVAVQSVILSPFLFHLNL